MKDMFANFKFHPVGQGCFYTGIIETRDMQRFNFVYDCGSNTKGCFLQNCIDKHKKQIRNHIDLLIISHFDEDHINGVLFLLKSNPVVYCRRLIIPYYSIIERVYICATIGNLKQEYLELLKDPIAYFSTFNNIGEIIVVGTEESFRGIVNSGADSGPVFPLFENMDQDGNILFNDYSGADRTPVKQVKPGNYKSTANVRYFVLPYHMVIAEDIWQFTFYLQMGSLKEVVLPDKFKRLLSRANDYPELFKPENLKELKGIYRSFGKKMNNTSLVLLHKATDNKEGVWALNENNQLFYNRVATLLTGDIELDKEQKVEELFNYYGGMINLVNWFQVPHHGSKYSWYLPGIKNRLHHFPVYIINHGFNRKTHPHKDVMNDIKGNIKRGVIRRANEKRSFEYRLRFGSKESIINATLVLGKPIKRAPVIKLKKGVHK